MRVIGIVGLVLLVAGGVVAVLQLVPGEPEVGPVALDEVQGTEAPEEAPALLVGRAAPAQPDAPDAFAEVSDVRALVRGSVWSEGARTRLVSLARSSPPVLAELVEWIRPRYDKDRSPFKPAWRSTDVPGLDALYRTLRELAPESVPVLAEALGDDEDDLRWRVAICLGRMGEHAAAAVPALVAQLDTGPDDVYVQVAVLAALGSIGEPARVALPRFRAYLKDDRFHDDLRAAAAEGFLVLAPPGKETFEACGMALRDQSFEICVRLLPAIGELRKDGAPMVPELLTLIQDPEAHGIVRWHAIQAVGRVGADSKTAIAVLHDIAMNGDEEDSIRQAAILALARIVPKGRDLLFKTLAATDVDTRLFGVETLLDLPDEERVDPARLLALLDTVRKDPEVDTRAEAVYLAGRIPDAVGVVVPWLKRWLDDGDDAVSGPVLYVATEQPDTTGAVARLLVDRLGDARPAVRETALAGLAQRAEEGYGDEVHLRDLVLRRAVLACMEDENPGVRSQALATLGALAPEGGMKDEAVLKMVLAKLDEDAPEVRYAAASWIVNHAPQHRQRTLPVWIERSRSASWDFEAWEVLREAGPKAKEALPGLLKVRERVTYPPMRKQLDEVIAAIREP